MAVPQPTTKNNLSNVSFYLPSYKQQQHYTLKLPLSIATVKLPHCQFPLNIDWFVHTQGPMQCTIGQFFCQKLSFFPKFFHNSRSYCPDLLITQAARAYSRLHMHLHRSITKAWLFPLGCSLCAITCMLNFQGTNYPCLKHKQTGFALHMCLFAAVWSPGRREAKISPSPFFFPA